MTTLDMFLLAVGLSMDAFALSIASGSSMKELDMPNALKMGLFFGGAHTIMPILGWLIGLEMRNFITGFDHWIAFGLLGFLGVNMFIESLKDDEAEEVAPSAFDDYGKAPRRSCGGAARRPAPFYAPGRRADFAFGGPAGPASAVRDKPSNFDTRELSLLAVATSVDAMAVGLTFSMLTIAIGPPAILIGVVVFTFSVSGVILGSRAAGGILGSLMEKFGGLVLVGIGAKILFEHIG